MNPTKEKTLFEVFLRRGELGDDTFVFLKQTPNWLRTENVFLGSEAVYDDCEETECGTPDWIFEKGYRYGFLSSDISETYDMVWVANDGPDTFENFCTCMSNFVTNDALTFP